MKYVCEFCGGRLDGAVVKLEHAETMTEARSRDWSRERSMGCLVPRKELDNRPRFPDYAGPMWDGLRYNGRHDFQVSEEVKKTVEPVAVLRYEAPRVYDRLSR